jgi:hypothetical protein
VHACPARLVHELRVKLLSLHDAHGVGQPRAVPPRREHDFTMLHRARPREDVLEFELGERGSSCFTQTTPARLFPGPAGAVHEQRA